ncbi:MAG: hypothetical protein ABI846_07450 [Rudaea sp.]
MTASACTCGSTEFNAAIIQVRTRARCRLARQKHGRLLADVHDDRTGLEQRETLFLVHGHLAERLHGAMLGRVLGTEFKQLLGIRQPGFLERPAHSDIADEALHERRGPLECCYADVGH